MRQPFQTYTWSVLDAMASCDCQSELWWRTDAEYAPITFFVQCSDEFDFATADCERVTPENFLELQRAISDCQVAENDKWCIWGPLLFCARVRKRRPMRRLYEKENEAVVALFNACGPERK